MKGKSNIPDTEAAVQWTTDVLKQRNVVFITSPESILKTPYSSVTKFSTVQGVFYLKETPSDLFVEAKIIQILKNKINALVPSILDVNSDLHCFLMLDAGLPLRDYLKTNFQPNLLIEGIKQYTDIQSEAENIVEEFLALGVPNWRLKELPNLYMRLISKKEALQRDGLLESEFKSLQNLYPTFVALCEDLSKFKIPETLDHCDFHDNNILINPKNNHLTLIDLGEIVITHPFFSLLSFISKTAYQYSLTDEHPFFIDLLDACFNNWLKVANKNDLMKTMLIAKKIWPIYSALGYYRLIVSSGMGMDENSLISYFGAGRNAGRFAKYFKDFIKSNLDIEPGDLSKIKLSESGSRIIKL